MPMPMPPIPPAPPMHISSPPAVQPTPAIPPAAQPKPIRVLSPPISPIRIPPSPPVPAISPIPAIPAIPPAVQPMRIPSSPSAKIREAHHASTSGNAQQQKKPIHEEAAYFPDDMFNNLEQVGKRFVV